MRKLVGGGNVRQCDFNVFDGLPCFLHGFNRSLVLMQQSNSINQGEILVMVTTGAGFIT